MHVPQLSRGLSEFSEVLVFPCAVTKQHSDFETCNGLDPTMGGHGYFRRTEFSINAQIKSRGDRRVRPSFEQFTCAKTTTILYSLDPHSKSALLLSSLARNKYARWKRLLIFKMYQKTRLLHFNKNTTFTSASLAFMNIN